MLTWPWFSERHGYHFNGYLVRHASGNVCVDPVDMSDDVLDQLADAGVARIVLTNRNHVRASGRLSERTGAPVAIHSADAAHARDQGAHIAEELSVGDQVGPFVVLDARGKSSGEVALHWPERRLLLVGDACVGAPPGQCKLLPDAVIDDSAGLQRTLHRLASEVDFDTLLLADGASILSGGREALRTLVQGFS